MPVSLAPRESGRFLRIEYEMAISHSLLPNISPLGLESQRHTFSITPYVK
jgi:hypothetical protein